MVGRAETAATEAMAAIEEVVGRDGSNHSNDDRGDGGGNDSNSGEGSNSCLGYSKAREWLRW
jgi:hypothetical protein